LASRLKFVLTQTIDTKQSGFWANRCILDSVLVANEIFD